MDIKLQLAQEIADQIGAQIYPDRCRVRIAGNIECAWPLMEKPEQGIPFCWNCVTNKTTAAKGRALLLKAKLAAQGLVIQEVRPPAPVCVPTDEEDESPWPSGVPL